MRFTVVDSPPPSRQGGKQQIYADAVDAAVEHEGQWLRVDELEAKVMKTCYSRTSALKRVADAYAHKCGFSNGFEVVSRRDGERCYPFIRKLPAGRV